MNIWGWVENDLISPKIQKRKSARNGYPDLTCERTLQQPMMNNETIMLSEYASLLRDIPFGVQFLVKNVVSFSFTVDWFLFLHFFSSTGKKKT